MLNRRFEEWTLDEDKVVVDYILEHPHETLAAAATALAPILERPKPGTAKRIGSIRIGLRAAGQLATVGRITNLIEASDQTLKVIERLQQAGILPSTLDTTIPVPQSKPKPVLKPKPKPEPEELNLFGLVTLLESDLQAARLAVEQAEKRVAQVTSEARVLVDWIQQTLRLKAKVAKYHVGPEGWVTTDIERGTP